MHDLSGKQIAILATDGYEQSELEIPYARLREAGAKVDIVSLKSGVIKSWHNGDWGRAMDVDHTLADSSSSDYDALVLPGGQINPDLLRVETSAIAFIQDFWNAGKVVAAICHAALAADRGRHRQGPQPDILPLGQDRRHQCRRQLARRRRGRRPGPRHQPQADRPREFLPQDRRGSRRRHPSSPRSLIF